MDNIRLILFFALAFTGLMLYQAWMEDYGQTPQTVVSDASAPAGSTIPAAVENNGSVPAPVSAGAEVPAPAAAPATYTPVENEQIIQVKTDVLDLEISTRGGNLLKVLLQDYAVSPDTPEKKFRLLKPEPPDMFVAQSGLIGVDTESAPNHEAIYTAEKTEYVLSEGQDELTIAIQWSGDNGIQVTKKFIFERGSYVVRVVHDVSNNSGAPWISRTYSQLQRSPAADDGNLSLTARSYIGGAVYSPEEKYEKISFDDIEEGALDRDVTGGWIAMLQHYFIGAWIPPKDSSEHFFTKSLPGSRYIVGMYSPSVTVAEGSSYQFENRLFVGPKLQESLDFVAPGLALTVDYGWLTVLAQPLFWLLNKLHDLTNNWGWAIIFLTMIIKLVFYKLSAASYKSMAKMRKFTPRMQALKDRYGDDKQRLQQAMMEMYKTEKINPLGGCLPIMVQIPVFIALYWVLLESVELRHAPFALWINNLTAKDPYYVLPLLMGISMFIQQKLNPAPPDPMQAKIMQALPFVFTVFFAFFPAGLVLYWVVNNVLSILQQWHITREIEKAG